MHQPQRHNGLCILYGGVDVVLYNPPKTPHFNERKGMAHEYDALTMPSYIRNDIYTGKINRQTVFRLSRLHATTPPAKLQLTCQVPHT